MGTPIVTYQAQALIATQDASLSACVFVFVTSSSRGSAHLGAVWQGPAWLARQGGQWSAPPVPAHLRFGLNLYSGQRVSRWRDSSHGLPDRGDDGWMMFENRHPKSFRAHFDSPQVVQQLKTPEFICNSVFSSLLPGFCLLCQWSLDRAVVQLSSFLTSFSTHWQPWSSPSGGGRPIYPHWGPFYGFSVGEKAELKRRLPPSYNIGALLCP